MNIFYKSSLALVLVATGLTSCSNEETPATMDAGQSVHMTVTVSRENMGQTRTEFSENNGNLDCRWNKDDILIVTDENGINKGNLTVKELKDGGVNAVFDGEIKGIVGNKAKLNYYYIGTKTEYKTDENKVYTADYSVQDGNFTSLPEKDLLSATAEIVISGGQSFVDNMELSRRISFAHFNLQFADGTTLSPDATVTVSGEGLNNAISIDTKNREASYTAGSVTITPAVADLYMVLLPSTKGFDLTFTVTDGDKAYNGTCKVNNPIGEGKYYRKDLQDGTYAGLPVLMEPKKEEEQPNNPGNTGSWGGPDTDMNFVRGNVTWTTDEDGWLVNCRNAAHTGGFGTYVTYKNNAIQNGLLSSKGTTAYFFQWGRWLGYPSTTNRTCFQNGNAYGNYPNSSQYLPGVETYNMSLGYVGDTGLVPSYCAAYMGGNSFTREKALNWSILFGMVSSLISHGDYIAANEECNWEDRCGNPCPDGYRIPTASELEALIPESVDEINGKHAEIKVVDGVAYAMRWEVINSGSVPYLEIKSIKSNLRQVEFENPIFDNATPIRFAAYGYLDNEGDLQGRGSIGVYWSNESGKNTINNTTGNGGKYLEIDFNKNTAVMGIGVALRSFGAPIVSIKDEQAKSSTLTPLFPVLLKHNCKYF